MNYKIQLSTILLLLLISTSLFSQSGKYYSTDNELSSSLINQLYQDHKGYIWIATEYGLNKFDGNHFTTYKHKEGDKSSLMNNYVRSLYEDSQRNLYVGCVNGVMKYDRASDSFLEIKMIKDGKTINPHVVQACEIKDGEILFATAGYGIFRMALGKDCALYDKEISKGLPGTYVSALIIDSTSTLWIGTENDGIMAYSLLNGKSSKYKYPQLSSNNITTLIEDNNKNIVAGTLNNGISIYERKSGTFSPINDNDLSVKHLALVNGKILIATDGQGVKQLNGKKITNYDINGAPFDMTNAKVHYLLTDNNDNLWIGLFQKGIVFIPNKNSHFSYWGNKFLSANPIGNGCVMAIYGDKNSDIWVGCDSEGIFQLDKWGNHKKHFSPAKGNENVPKTPLCMFEDSKHNFWIGSYASGLALFDRNSGKCRYIPELKNQKIYCITEDDNSTLYIATLGYGFFSYNLNSGKIEQIRDHKSQDKSQEINTVINDWINNILFDKDGYLWIAHYNGVSCYDLKKKEYINRFNIKERISRCIAYSILKDHSGNIYFGTSNGMYILNKKDHRIYHYTKSDGMPNEIVCGIEKDSYNNIWLSTYMGISKFIPNENRFINYYTGDGIQGNEFTHGACYKSNEGCIYFGGIHGVTSFIPQEDENKESRFSVYIVGFSIYNTPVNAMTKSGNNYVINKSVSDAQEFNLSYKDNTFTVDVSTLDFDNPEKIVYQYRILQMGNKWLSTTPGVNKITFNNLTHGEYTLQIRAEKQGAFSDIRSISIIISPPWYLSWWAYCLYIFAFLFVIRLIVVQMQSKIQHKRDMMKREHAEQISEAKLQFFINISHEIRTPMTLIISPLEKLIAEVSDPNLKETYLMIYRNSQRILRLINQLMDIRKIDKGQMFLKFRQTDMVGFINDVKHTFEHVANKKGIDYKFTHNMDNLYVWVDMNNFDKIMINLLSNAFKFTPENGSIEINLTTGHDDTYKGALRNYFQITVSDSGIGIDKDKIEKIFERFYQIDNDVTQSNFGTGIGLHMCRSLIELHHGMIKAENREDMQGSRFIIRVPMGADHLKETELDLTEVEETKLTTKALEQKIAIEEKNEIESNTTDATGKKSSYRIMIIEDDFEIINYLKSEIGRDYRIITAHDGKEGYEKILSEKPDLIISDVMMPEMDGLTLCKKIKQNNNINQIPIILLTAKSKTEDQVEGMEIGADAYMVKPFNIDILKSTISNLIEKRKMLKNKYGNLQDQLEKVNKIELKSSDEMLMNRIMKTINEHLSDPELNVEMLAREVGISRVHIHRKLKELTNMSARDFIRTIRLKQASELLQEKKLTIAEVAYAVGFVNPSHFSNTFKENFGISPKDYMNKFNS